MTPSTTTARPKLEPREAVGVERCWCGTPVAPGSRLYTFRDFSDTVAPLLRGRSFCGVACARAYLLETMEMFESAWIGDVVGDAEAVASALRIAYFYSATEK